MNINGYKKNNYKYNYNCKSYCNCYKGKFNCTIPALKNLYEVENFLCNFKKICKFVNLYKFLK